MYEATGDVDRVMAPLHPDVAAVRAMVASLASGTGPEGCGAEVDAVRVDLLRALEELGNAAAGLQVCVTEAFDHSQRQQQVAAGVRAEKVGLGVAAQVGLARMCSPHRGSRHLSLARILRAELPCTYRALRAGRISEYGATLMAQGTACVSLEHRAQIDEAIAGDLEQITRLGERGIAADVAKEACRLDPASVVERRRRAESERRVTLRPAPDTMCYLSALMPVADGVAAYAALTGVADSARSAGDPRSRGHVMADALRDGAIGSAVHRKGGPDIGTGPANSSVEVADSATAEPVDPDADEDAGDLGGAPDRVGIVLDVVMTDRQLFGIGEGSEGGVLIGGMLGALHHGDADLARQLAALTPADRLWIRRLYQHPDTGELVAIDSHRRRFPRGLQRLIRFRDQHCRTAWCRAPIRHTDHARSWAGGGTTELANGQGLCEACNYAKDAPGWRTRPLRSVDIDRSADRDDHSRGDRIQVTTPTGHSYATAPPALPGTATQPAGSARILWTYRAQPTIEIVCAPPPRAA